MSKTEKLQATLPTITTWDFKRNDSGELDLIPVEVKPHSFIRDGLLFISMEHGDNAGNSDTMQVNPILEAWAEKQGGYWEWYDAGCVVFAN